MKTVPFLFGVNMPSRYSIDKDNLLVIRRKGRVMRLSGYFSIDEKNRLIYWLNETPAWKRKYGFPDKIVFCGHWRLNPNYDLELELRQGRIKVKPELLVLKGEIISVKNDKLAFQAKSVNKSGLLQLRVFELTGVWQADDLNQLSFAVSKKDNPDLLTFEGRWQLNKNQQLTYTYQKADLRRKSKSSSTITFYGFWQITAKNQLSYILSASTKSRFDFKVQLETPNLYPQKGVVKYRLGVGLKEQGLNSQRIISLYGTWKINRRIGLIFEVEYGGGKMHAMEFAAEVRLSENNQVIFALKNKKREDLGISIIFTHRLLKQLDAELFLRLKHSVEEEGIDFGLRFPF